MAWRNTERPEFSIPAFAVTLMWVSYSYSAFHASAYVASEVKHAAGNVARTMLHGPCIVMLVYLLFKGTFVFAPAPDNFCVQGAVAALAARPLAGQLYG